MSEWLKLSKNVYRKELLPVGSYRKDSDDLDFDISLDTLKHIRDVTNEMIGAGVRVPLVNTHDGEDAHGQILKVSVDESCGKGGSSFVDVEFSDDTCREKAMRNDISAFIPPEFVDGKGNAWKRPLRHVAITPYPVIPGLRQWESIAASFHSSIRRTPMLENLEKTLALSFDAKDDEAARQKAVVKAVATLAEQSLELSEQLKTLKDEKRNSKPAIDPINYPESVVLSFGRARSREINDLVHKAKITPAVAKELTKRYCNSKCVALALSEGTTDDFDDLLKILSKNAAPAQSGRHSAGDYAIKLSHNGGSGDSAIVEAAKRRAEVTKV